MREKNNTLVSLKFTLIKLEAIKDIALKYLIAQLIHRSVPLYTLEIVKNK